MKKIIFNLKLVLILFLCLSLALFGGLILQQYRSRTRLAVAAGENTTSLTQRYSLAGTIYDINGEVLAESESGIRKYNENPETAAAVLHTVGDYTHRIDNTIETRYQSVLLGTGRNPLHQLWLDIRGKGLYGDDIVLTLDSELCLQASRLLKNNRGSIVMINYLTGAVIASVSTPGTSPQSVINYEGFSDTSLFNRALLGSYAPGSVFKLVTAAAWLDSENYDPEFKLVCSGESTIHPDAANENGDGHGEVDLAEAMMKSCNVFFGEIGVRTGREKMFETAEQFGITQPYSLDLLKGASGDIYTEQDDIMLSWLAIGQPAGVSRLSITPLELARLTGAIATGGDLYASHIIDHLEDPDGRSYNQIKAEVDRSIIDSDTAELLETMMIDVVKNGSGTAASAEGLEIAGKTGTVQVEGQANNALFVGYLAEYEHPYAIAVVVEEGGSGGSTAAPMAAAMFKAAVAAD